MQFHTPLRPEDPRYLGPYKLLGRLGEGGMGVVYLGEDGLVRVAIKRIKPEYADRHRAMRRLRRELDAARRVPRYCTATIYGYDFKHDPPYIVSEYIKGPTLKAVVATEGPLDDSNLHSLAIAVAGALKEIHLAGVVHGDLTPRNVMLSLHGPRVIDFGIARVPEQTVSSSIEIAGTPPYMAPEHFTNGPVTTAADVFAWGSVMAFAGTGRLPFGEGSLAQLSHRICNESPDLVGLDSVVRPLVEAAMRKRPEDRPDADRLLEELKRSARAVDVGLPRTREVDKVLATATVGVDRPSRPADGNRLPAESSGTGFSPIPLGVGLAILSLLLLLGIWFHTFGIPGSVANVVARSLFGYGAYLVPLLGLGWAAVALQHPRDASLWPAGRGALEDLFWQPKSVRAWLRLGWGLTRVMRSAVIGGPVLLFLGAVFLLHLARGVPPITATNFEREESGGLLGAIVVRSLQGARLGWLALPLGLLLLLGGTAMTAWTVRRRWGPWLATGFAVTCVVALLGATFYLRDHNYQHWARIDPATGQIAAFRGLHPDRARLLQGTPITEADVPASLRAQLQAGVPAHDLPDALRLANDLAFAYNQPVNARTFLYGGTELAFGTCLETAERGAASVPCDQPHGAEVYGVASVPYSRFPDTDSRSPLKDFAEGACPSLFAPYVGLPQERTELEADWFVPTKSDWAAGARAVGCVLKPAPGRVFSQPARGSRQVFVDDFAQAGNWSRDFDSKPRCAVEYPGDGTLSIANGTRQEYAKVETGLLCVATPSTRSVDPSVVRDVQVSMTATAPANSPSTNRVGFVCRESDNARYHLTAARDGSWRIEKKIDGRDLVPLAVSGADITPITGRFSLRAECSGGENGSPGRLKLWRLRGGKAKLLGAATDGDPLATGTVGLAIVAADPETFQVTFDDFVAKAARQ
jgi:hypothetical protein